jgi:fatty-acyl-CoA synthase
MKIPLTPLRCLERAAEVFPSLTGVICGESSFTYAQFVERCRRLASGLRKFGIEPGDRVAFLSFNTHKLLEGYFGVVQAGAIVMPLNVRLSVGELRGIVRHSEAGMILFEEEFRDTVEQLKADCGCVAHWIALDGGAAPETSYEQLLEGGEPEPADIFAVDEDSVAELFYTSGSTGTPKGVMLTHRNLYLNALDMAAVGEDPKPAIELHTIPLFHANGWGRPQCATMMGHLQVMVRRFDPPKICQLIERHRATNMCLVPTMANLLLNDPAIAKYELSSMKVIMLGGAAASPELIARLEKRFPARVFCGYGLTETSPVLTISREKPRSPADGELERLRRAASTGWPTPGVRVRVVDLYGNDVPKDGKSVGEIAAQSDHVMEGYYKDQASTDAVIENNWFRSGDMAVWDESGFLQIVDRKKEIIVSGGENISSIEVERAILLHESVLECAVVGAPDDRWGEVPAAIVVLKEGHELTEQDLLAFLRTQLGGFKIPRKIEITHDNLPKTGTGKIRKLILRERFWAGKTSKVQG